MGSSCSAEKASRQSKMKGGIFSLAVLQEAVTPLYRYRYEKDSRFCRSIIQAERTFRFKLILYL